MRPIGHQLALHHTAVYELLVEPEEQAGAEHVQTLHARPRCAMRLPSGSARTPANTTFAMTTTWTTSPSPSSHATAASQAETASGHAVPHDEQRESRPASTATEEGSGSTHPTAAHEVYRGRGEHTRICAGRRGVGLGSTEDMPTQGVASPTHSSA